MKLYYNSGENTKQLHFLFQDDSYIGDFINMLKTKEDFENCGKLFQLLYSHISDTQMCAVIILIINAAADNLSKHSTKSKSFYQ